MLKLRDFLLAAITVVVLTLAVYLTFAISRWAGQGTGKFFWNGAGVIHEVQTLSDLVPVKYVMEKVVVLEDVKVYGESRVLLLAHGVVKAGVDLKRLTPEDVTISDKKITIALPIPRILDAYLDDKCSQIIDPTTGLLRAFDKNLEPAARQNAVDDIAGRPGSAGFLRTLKSRLKWSWVHSCGGRASNRWNSAEANHIFKKTPDQVVSRFQSTCLILTGRSIWARVSASTAIGSFFFRRGDSHLRQP